jgi:hypothetical protein
LRYADQVKQETESFINQQIKLNYFNGDSKLDLSLTLGEAEALFGASDEVKALGESGQLKALHDRCKTLLEKSETSYMR